MKTLYITQGTAVKIDPETNSVDRYKSSRQCIDYLYLAKEPMHVIYGFGEYKREVDVDVNDIIITFYTDEFKDRFVVVKSKEWAENIIGYEKEEQRKAEEWAKTKAADGESIAKSEC